MRHPTAGEYARVLQRRSDGSEMVWTGMIKEVTRERDDTYIGHGERVMLGSGGNVEITIDLGPNTAPPMVPLASRRGGGKSKSKANKTKTQEEQDMKFKAHIIPNKRNATSDIAFESKQEPGKFLTKDDGEGQAKDKIKLVERGVGEDMPVFLTAVPDEVIEAIQDADGH